MPISLGRFVQAAAAAATSVPDAQPSSSEIETTAPRQPARSHTRSSPPRASLRRAAVNESKLPDTAAVTRRVLQLDACLDAVAETGISSLDVIDALRETAGASRRGHKAVAGAEVLHLLSELLVSSCGVLPEQDAEQLVSSAAQLPTPDTAAPVRAQLTRAIATLARVRRVAPFSASVCERLMALLIPKSSSAVHGALVVAMLSDAVVGSHDFAG